MQVEQYVPKCLVYSILWSFAGDAKMKVSLIGFSIEVNAHCAHHHDLYRPQVRHSMSDYIRSITTITLPPQTGQPILDFEVIFEIKAF